MKIHCKNLDECIKADGPVGHKCVNSCMFINIMSTRNGSVEGDSDVYCNPFKGCVLQWCYWRIRLDGLNASGFPSYINPIVECPVPVEGVNMHWFIHNVLVQKELYISSTMVFFNCGWYVILKRRYFAV